MATTPRQRTGLLDMMGQGDSSFAGWLDPRRNALQQTFAGMVGHDSTKGALRGASQGAVQGRQTDTAYQTEVAKQQKAQDQLNQTVEWMRQNAPQYASMVESGMPVGEAWSAAVESMKPQGGADPTSAMQNYDFLVGQGMDHETALERTFGGGQTINVGGNNDIGTIPSGMMVTRDEQDNITGMQPIPGGPAAQKAQQAEQQEATKALNRDAKANIVTEDIDRALGMIEENPVFTTGMGGQVLSNISGTQARDVKGLLDTVRANSGFRELQAMRDASPTGGALGQVSEREIAFLQALLGNVEQSQSDEQLTYNLRRLKDHYLNVVHGQGNRPTTGTSGDWTDMGNNIRIRPVD